VFSLDARTGKVTPQLTIPSGNTDYYALGPADFATIYNTAPLLQASYNGAGQTIAIVGRSNVSLQDVTNFRTLFSLGAGNTSVVLDGPDPGIAADESESVLDLEWSNAVAPGAAVVLVSAQDTETTSGLDLAALHIIENNMAGVMSLSYNACEADLGTTGNQFVQALWQQAAAQGITVTVSSGDNGSANWDDQDTSHIAQYGMAVNGFASTPYNIAVGGTDFNDAAFTTYWRTTNSATFESAPSLTSLK
jgi:subtilase family serine protease